jgi:MFS family permease
VLLSMEWGDQKRRGLMGSWPQLGVAAGLFLGTLVFTIVNRAFGEDAFVNGAWRIPFLLSLVLVAIGLIIRLQILETPMFAAVVSEQKVAKAPVKDVVRDHWKEIVLSALVRMSEQMPFYVVTTFVLAYLIDPDHGYSKNFVLVGTLIASAIELVLVPTFGHLSDTIGRKRIYMTAAAIMGVWGFVYFGMLDSGVAWIAFLGVCLGLVPHAMHYGPQAALIAESFPTSLRYGGSGLGYQLASLIAGGPAPLVATFLLHQFGTAYAISAYILVSALITLAACAALPDRSRADISDDATYARKAPDHAARA